MNAPRILIAPGPYKECLPSDQVALFMHRGVREIFPNAEVKVHPLCDGGSGLTRVLVTATGGRLIATEVIGPTGSPIESYFGILGDGTTGVIESAAAAGLSLVPKSERNPLTTSTYGVGQLISHAIEAGCKSLIVGCGDSGTNDCGIGCASALGIRFRSRRSGHWIEFPTGADLADITEVDTSRIPLELRDGLIPIKVACNLTSILCGPEGTSRIYGPQKGGTASQVEMLHAGIDHLVNLIYNSRGIDLAYVPGAGGAGGLAAALYAFLGAKLSYSIEVVDEFLHLDAILKDSDLVLTGEGCLDDRTATGKVACGIALKAKKYDITVVAIVGKIAHDCEDVYYNGIDAAECICDGPMSLEESMEAAGLLIQRATARVLRLMFRKPGPKRRICD